MKKRSKVPVAFTFVNDGKQWHGGLNYFRSLFLALESVADGRVEPVAFVGAGADVAGYGFPQTVRVVKDPVFDRLSWKWLLNKLSVRLFGVPHLANRVILREGISVSSHGAPSGIKALRSIGWIPDFQHLHLPQFFQEAELKNRAHLYRQLIERSDRVIVSSESARRDLQSFTPEFIDKACVLRFCAMRPTLDSSIDPAALYDLKGPFFYVPNQLWAHKNHLTVVRALAQLSTEYPNLTVVCSGALDDYRNAGHLAALREEIEALGVAESFRLLGVVPYPHIAALMQRSQAVINPSLFEGWSTTVEEAKTLGVPMILSDIEVHREQCEADQATFFARLDPTDLARAMREQLSLPGDARSRDTKAALERHDIRVAQFARTYESIIADVAGAAEAA